MNYTFKIFSCILLSEHRELRGHYLFPVDCLWSEALIRQLYIHHFIVHSEIIL